MKIEIIAICEAATDSQGKLNILGAFDSIFASKLPATHPQCTIALRLRFTKIEEGSHKIRINVVDADGKLVIPSFDGGLTIRIKPGEEYAVANLIINMQRLKFEKFGEYAVDLAINGRQEASLPFFVRQITPPPQVEQGTDQPELLP
ncbi:MAG: hypothetical protein GX811_09545 [Lentisphaerae bacterium]|nr:hypothetical protein [Lentisphaerota bacterium]